VNGYDLGKEKGHKKGPRSTLTKIDYLTFRKLKKNKAGEKLYRWYYYFYDQNGKKVQKACPKCRNRSDAETYIKQRSGPS
jgi:hypothetical protein